MEALAKATAVRFKFLSRILSNENRLASFSVRVSNARMLQNDAKSVESLQLPFDRRPPLLQAGRKNNESEQRLRALGTSLFASSQPFSANRTAVGQGRA
jgi:hypothetical protein